MEERTPLPGISLLLVWRKHLQLLDAATFGQIKPVLKNLGLDCSTEPKANPRSVIADSAQVLGCFQCKLRFVAELEDQLVQTAIDEAPQRLTVTFEPSVQAGEHPARDALVNSLESRCLGQWVGVAADNEILRPGGVAREPASRQ